MIGRVIITFMVVALVVAISVSADCAKKIYVRTDGNDSNNGESWSTAKKTVNAAMDVAEANDTIWVARGTYQVGTLYLKDSIRLRGGFRGDETDSSQYDSAANVTILKGDGSGPVVTMPEWASFGTGIMGFTIRGGLADRGGGVYSDGSGAYVMDCIIEHNKAKYGGGGIYCSGLTSSITHNIIRDNIGSYYGGGIYCEDSSANIANNLIVNNIAKLGAGIYCERETPTIVNNTIADNIASYEHYGFGGGIRCEANAVISNNIIVYNKAVTQCGGIDAASASNPTLRNNCIYGNENGDYLGVAPGQGDISQNPLFDLPVGNYHLLPYSPCVNAGLNSASTAITVDIDAQTRINAGVIDMGADEYWPNKTYYVNGATGNDSNSGLSWGQAKKTVGAALKAATWRDWIWVAKGTYAERIALKRSIELYGGFVGNEMMISQRPQFPRPLVDPNASILDGSVIGTVVTSMADTIPTPTIDGFTIRNGNSSLGGGIACYNNSNILIKNNTIRQNIAINGGGIYCEDSSPEMWHSIISDNTAQSRGGGFFSIGSSMVEKCAPEVYFSAITSNQALTSDGGGAFCQGDEPKFFNSLIAKNTASGAGGGIRTWESSAVVSNNIIAQNKASYGGGIHIHKSFGTIITNNTITANSVTQFGGGIDYVSSHLTMSNNIVALNTMGIGQYDTGNNVTLQDNDVWGNYYMDYYVVSPGTGDISANPQFVDWSGGDYHLGAFSPCINAGWNGASWINVYDIDGQPRVNADYVDMGADEWYAILPPHKILIKEGPVLRPQIAKPGEPIYCNIGVQDTYGQDLTYEWSDGGAGGYFSNRLAQAPIYIAPPNTSGQSKNITLTCAITSAIDESVSESGSVELTVESVLVPGDFTGDGQVTIGDATRFVNEWVRMHQTPPPAFDPAIDGPFDLYPHTSGVWPNWTPIGDSVINISDATAFIQCWTGSHPSSPASTATVNRAAMQELSKQLRR